MHFYEARTAPFGDDKALTVIRNVTDRRRVEAELQESQLFAQRVAETTPNVLFVYDLIERRNVYANERSVDVLGYSPKEISEMGENFLRSCMHPEDISSLPALGREYSGRRDGEVFEHIFRMKHKNGEYRWVQRSATIFSRTPEGLPKQILGSVTDITRFKEAERELQHLSSSLLSIQDEERRRIARELHDVTGQNLTAIALNLAVLEKSAKLDAASREILLECQKLSEESKQEIRTLSFLLHPPMLDQFGLVGALEWYFNGFKQRTKLDVRLDGGHDIGRLPAELETDLFRVIQEGLANIVRHSGSEAAVVRLEKRPGEITVKIEDRGRGLATRTSLMGSGKGTPAGVGIPGMRERLRQHGGSLDIRSNGDGTTLTVVVPVPAETLSR
jgi:PAS domain S-box-containing protein